MWSRQIRIAQVLRSDPKSTLNPCYIFFFCYLIQTSYFTYLNTVNSQWFFLSETVTGLRIIASEVSVVSPWNPSRLENNPKKLAGPMGSLGEGRSIYIYFIMKTTKYHFMKITMSTFCAGIVEEKRNTTKAFAWSLHTYTYPGGNTADLFFISSTATYAYPCIFKCNIRATSKKKPSKWCASKGKGT